MHKSFKLHLGDCMDVLSQMADDSVDLVVTSPPYNLNKSASGGGTSTMSYAGWYPDDMPEESYQDWQVGVIRELVRVCRGSIFYNHKIRYAWHGRNKYRTPSNIYHPMDWLREFPIWQEIVWDRCGTSGHANGRCMVADERIYQIGKPLVFNNIGLTSIWRISPTKNVGHVCTFPMELPLNCIRMCSDEGMTVLDPFMGLGTVGVACLEVGRNFIGIEKSAEYFRGASDAIGDV